MTDLKIQKIEMIEPTFRVLNDFEETAAFRQLEAETLESCPAHSFYECKRKYVPPGPTGGATFHRCGHDTALQVAIDGLAIPNVYREDFEQEVVSWPKMKTDKIVSWEKAETGDNFSFEEYGPAVAYTFHPNGWTYSHWIIVKNNGMVHVCGPRISTYFSPDVYPCTLEAYWLVVEAEAKRGNKLASMIVPLLKPFSAGYLAKVKAREQEMAQLKKDELTWISVSSKKNKKSKKLIESKVDFGTKIETKVKTKIDNKVENRDIKIKVYTTSKETDRFMHMEMKTRDACSLLNNDSEIKCKRPGGHHLCCRESALSIAIQAVERSTTVYSWDKIKSDYGGEYSTPTVAIPLGDYWVFVRHCGTVLVCHPYKTSTYFSPAVHPRVLAKFWTSVQEQVKMGNKIAQLIVPILGPLIESLEKDLFLIRGLYSACIHALFGGAWRHRRVYKYETHKEEYLYWLAKKGHDVIFDHSIPKPVLETLSTEFRGIPVVRRPGDDLTVRVPHSGCTEASFDYSVRGPFGHLFERYARVIDIADEIEDPKGKRV